MYRWNRFVSVLAAGSALVFMGISSCSKTDPDAVAVAKGWVLTEAELKAEFERVNDEIQYSAATPKQKSDFAQLLLDKEIVLGIARTACPEPDYKRARLDRIMWEKILSRMFLEHRRNLYKLTPEEQARQLQLVSREAKVKQAAIRDADFDAVLEAAKSGMTFPQIVEKFAVQTSPNAPRLTDTGIRIGQGPRELVRAILLNDVPAGVVVGPVRTTRGVFLCLVESYMPFDLNQQPEALERAKAVVEDLNYIPFNQAYTDSLFGLAKMKVHEEQVPLIGERFGAYWDSIQNALPGVDFQTLRAPVWRFDATESALPMLELYDKTYTVGDFVKSLDQVDLDYWPTGMTPGATRFQVGQRGYRLIYEMEALKTGYTNDPEFLATMERIYEEHLLEQYRDRTIKPTQEPTEEQMRARYSESSALYLSEEKLSFGVLIFPPAEEKRVAAVRAQLEANPEKWEEIGAAEASRGTGVQFLPDSGIMRTIDAPPDPSWTPLRDTAVVMEANQLSAPVRTQHGLSIVRCNQRLHAAPMSYEEAKEQVRAALVETMTDQEIERQIQAARQARKAKVLTEKLGVPAA